MFIDKLELAPRASKALVKLRHFRFDHDFGAHGEISNVLEGVGQSEHQHQEAGQEVIIDSQSKPDFCMPNAQMIVPRK